MYSEQYSVILVEPQNPINLGTVIRAMKNMGIRQLSLVNPAEMDWEKTQISAHKTHEYLDTMKTFQSLDEALEGYQESYGFSARHRTQAWASAPVEEAIARSLGIAAGGGRIGLVFGREQTGLTNEELERCTFRVHIPTSDYTSLNLAQAVLIALYELFRQSSGEPETVHREQVAIDNYAPGSRPATLDEQRRLLRRMGESLVDIGYFKSEAPNMAVHRLQNILTRAQLHDDEIHLLMGMCSEVSNYARLLKRGIEPSHCRPRDSLLD
ncbi:MAG: TrmJ/YjtD family RNA methyltransferase [Proteobacteria bacterium]|nr:TrmJ/YjtD family RNA methyltransferase [Pseudomonadota bacterium]